MLLQKLTLHTIVIFFVIFSSNLTVQAKPVEEVAKSERCKVCGMFVAKYATWITQIHHKSGKIMFFDGVKDMMVYYFDPAFYGTQKDDKITEIWVKDYYSLTWLDGRQAFYVVGSDVKGPMGHEFIPFSSKGAADTFMKDHHGERIMKFDEITSPMVESMRHGHKMMMK